VATAATICLVFGFFLANTYAMPPESGTVSAGQPSRFAVQLGAFSGSQQADSTKRQAEAAGLGSYIVTRGPYQCLLAGAFDYYIDAYVLAQAIKERGLAEGAFVVSVDSEAMPAGLPMPSAAQVSPIFRGDVARAASMPVQRLASPEYLALEALDRPGNEAGYRRALEDTLA
jgi:hypothetical protein